MHSAFSHLAPLGGTPQLFLRRALQVMIVVHEAHGHVDEEICAILVLKGQDGRCNHATVQRNCATARLKLLHPGQAVQVRAQKQAVLGKEDAFVGDSRAAAAAFLDSSSLGHAVRRAKHGERLARARLAV